MVTELKLKVYTYLKTDGERRTQSNRRGETLNNLRECLITFSIRVVAIALTLHC